MDLFLSICAIICGVVGILGAVIPILPGPALSLFGMLCAHWTDYSTMSTRTLWIWAVITAIVTLLDYFLPGYFSLSYGGLSHMLVLLALLVATPTVFMLISWLLKKLIRAQ